MELRVAIREGLLDNKTHKTMKLMTSYISTTYDIKPSFMDLEGAVFEDVDKQTCNKIVDDVKKKFKRQLRFIEITCF